MKILIYDCEIIRAIPDQSQPPETGIEYAVGWTDFETLGISVIGCHANWLIFPLQAFSPIRKNMRLFQPLVDEADVIIGFNSQSFDDNLCRANGIDIFTDFDILREVRVASGQPREYVQGQTRRGYNLDALARANGMAGKTGEGRLAPIWWQRGEHQRVIEYCLSDVAITFQILRLIQEGRLLDPLTGELLPVRKVEELLNK
jgi:DEAD/DEAH box helicase domain-containing protein